MKIKEGVKHWFCTIELTSMGYKPVFTVSTSIDGAIIKVRSAILVESQILPTIKRMTKDIESKATGIIDWSFVAEAKEMLDERGD